MIQVRAIDHIVLRTSRLSEMICFYCDVLGCTLERTLPADVGLSQLRAGNALIDLVHVDSKLGQAGGPAPTGSGNNMDHFCLRIAPFDEQDLLDFLSSHGIKAGNFETRYGAQGFGPSLYIQDPDGNTVELRAQQVLHQSATAT